ncbi:MAG: hypothetical protein COC22_01525 [Flavobacteriaceae bacterium]|nr:MAG: hypothetical protein COC22_01525 [Flavobacteriaceae bacterium]
MNKFKIIVILISLTSIAGFGQKPATVIHKAEVIEVVQVNSYSYLKIKENSVEKWLAVPTIKAEIGETYFYKGGMEMPDFTSNELKKTFKSVLFLGSISKTKEAVDAKPYQHDPSILKNSKAKAVNEKLTLTVESIKDGISISELMKNKKKYEGKTVKIKGQVTKFSAQVMTRNWIHLQDGTDFNGEYDLTFTSSDLVSIGSVVVLEGKVTLNKNFGAGYFYKIIIENAALIKEE